jgi:hypothetical protein
MNIETIEEVEKELERFSKRLQEAKARLQEDGSCRWSGCKETAALKRSALDLKNELTKLNKTQYD